MFGDFNDLLYSSDKKGRNEHPISLMEGYRSAIEDSSLIELELKGGEFTWEKSKGTSSWVRERLDRCFATDAWWGKFPLCMLSVFQVTKSDHDPIKLELMSTSISKKQFRFRFENTWLKEANFHAEISGFWQQLPALHLIPKLIELSRYMAHWGRDFFNKFREKVVRQKKIIEDLKDREDDDGIQLYFDEKENLNELLANEEVYWKQRAKKFWLKEGVTNSRFFHAAASSRKKLNHISSLKAEDGTMVSSHEGMCNILLSYFSQVFKESNNRSDTPSSEDTTLISFSQISCLQLS